MTAQKPTKGVVPNMNGVAGVLLAAAPPDLLFGRSQRQSPYDPLLIQLRDADEGSVLKFSDVKAKTSVYARSKKLEVPVLFAEKDGALYVRLAPASPGKKVLPVARDLIAEPNKSVIIKALGIGKDTVALIVAWGRLNGAPDLKPSTVDVLLSGLLRDGAVKLKEGKDSIEHYTLVAK